ncbi:MAG: hypothetical protein LBD51_00740, partial [Bifidobacteriaceae bacterium]|nr:hypothetical protein [Bifidobacteriaceae bacterium]
RRPGREWGEIQSALETGALVLVDDVEAVGGPPPAALPARGVLVAAYTTATALAFRPPTQLFHRHPLGVVLWSRPGGAGAAFGPGRAAGLELAGPRAPEPPGRGRLVVGGQSYPVQLES